MQSKRGFSLLETLLYIGIFAIIGGSLFGILTNVVRVSTREISGGEVASQLQFAMETINRLVRESSNIDTATSAATTTMKLRMTDPLLDPTCVTLANGVLKLAQGPDQYDPELCTTTTTDITTNKVVVDSALFKKIEFPGGKDQLSIDLQFSNTATGQNKISRALRAGVSRASAATFDSDLLPNNDATYEVGSSIVGGKRWKSISLSGLLNMGTSNGTPPITPKEGSLYYDTGLDTLRGYDGSSWKDIGSSLWVATSTHMYSNVTGNVGIGTTNPTQKLQIGNGTSDILFMDGPTGRTAISRTMPGIELSGGAMNTTSKYTPALKFMSTDPQLTTENPKFLAGIVGRSVETYAADTDGGMAIDFLTTPVDPGAASIPTTTMTIYYNGNVGIGVTAPTQKLDVNGYVKGTGLCIGADCKTAWPSACTFGAESAWGACEAQPASDCGYRIYGIQKKTRTITCESGTITVVSATQGCYIDLGNCG